LVQARYGFPAKGARVIAVTGTNGKTTTCLIINEMLKKAGYRTAMLTTAVNEIDGAAKPNTTHRTVLLTADLMRLFRRTRGKGIDFYVLEVTSQSLHQHKLLGIPVEVAVMTNFTQDHLDYHRTMENYGAAKARLFNSYMKPKVCVLNRDDAWYDYFAKESVGKVVSYGKRAKSTLQMKHVSVTPSQTEVTGSYERQAIKLTTPLVGMFNAYNAAAAALAGLQLGLSPAKVKTGVAALAAVPGRMERVDAGQNFSVIVDYAHTPDALQNALQTLQEVTKGKVIAVFGATGDRDKQKRPDMGAVAAKYADQIFLTDDETYTEDPAAIRAAVMQGIKAAGGTKKTTEISDRRQAIQAAFKAAKKGDTVLLAGLGHQNYRAMANQKQPWDEREVARDLLAE
jgi:UDP-N-acetylmuramoyl-L-alanyl-D-glutamate--2,6-diaminopimelate ligase